MRVHQVYDGDLRNENSLGILQDMLVSTVKVFPAMAVFISGHTAISQEPTHKPDEHVTAQAQDSTVVEDDIFEAVAVNGNPVSVCRIC